MSENENSAFLMPWVPLKWKPLYDIIISLHCSGYTNKAIAAYVNYSAVQVGNILRSPEAKRMIAENRSNLNKEAAVDRRGRLEAIQDKAIQRIEDAIFDEKLALNAPLRMMDASMSLLKGLGMLNGDGAQTTIHQKTVVISEGIAKKLFDGTALADRAKELHSGPTNE